MWANYVAMALPADNPDLYLYVAEIHPDCASKKRSRLIHLMMSEAPELAHYRHLMVSDFKATISRKQMQLDSPRINVTYRAEEEDEPGPRATTCTIFCRSKKTLSTQMLMDYLTTMDVSAVDQYGSKLELIQALSIFLNHHAKRPNNPAPIGSSNSLSEELGSGLRAVRSFFIME